MGSLKVYVDSSFRGRDGCCQTGFVFTCPNTKRMRKESSEVFYSLNNNDAEVYGIYVAIKTLFERYGVRDFLIYNDSIIACSMVKDGAVINNSVKKNHSLLMEIKYYLYENNIKVKTVRLPRHDPTLKICDKLSKSFRAKGRK